MTLKRIEYGDKNLDGSGKPDVNQMAGKSTEERMGSWRLRKAHSPNCSVGVAAALEVEG
ncbi:MAG: hypothetical protein GDA56_20470 [Hormoscilla sp. GM7CHS1pb]|nr:hypothetical protein [Hormoscilla sp. GM7CHS1pb]